MNDDPSTINIDYERLTTVELLDHARANLERAQREVNVNYARACVMAAPFCFRVLEDSEVQRDRIKGMVMDLQSTLDRERAEAVRSETDDDEPTADLPPPALAFVTLKRALRSLTPERALGYTMNAAAIFARQTGGIDEAAFVEHAKAAFASVTVVASGELDEAAVSSATGAVDFRSLSTDGRRAVYERLSPSERVTLLDTLDFEERAALLGKESP